MLTSKARHGIARTMPLLVLTGFVAAVFAVLSCARPAMAPARAAVAPPTNVKIDDCSEETFVPRTGIPDADGRLWDLDEIPGHTVRELDLRHAMWAGADLHDATFVDCDFRGCNLTGAILRGVTFENCHLEGATLEAAELTPSGVPFNDCYVRGARAQGSDLSDGPPQHQGRSSFVLLPDDPGPPAR
jgi:uncharacterized protein YjbI with pentapeptide repeats